MREMICASAWPSIRKGGRGTGDRPYLRWDSDGYERGLPPRNIFFHRSVLKCLLKETKIVSGYWS